MILRTSFYKCMAASTHARFHGALTDQGLPSYQPGLERGDLFIFDYGVIVCWGLAATQVRRLARLQCRSGSLCRGI